MGFPTAETMQVRAGPYGSDEDFLRCVEKRIDWVMASPIKCLYDLVEPFCAGCQYDYDVFDLYGFEQDDRTLVA